jgi:hypothetical protein
MPATVQILSYRSTGGGTPFDITSLEVRHKQADDDQLDLNAGVPIPPVGSGVDYYGYPKHWKISWTTTPQNKISNLRWYAADRPNTGDPALDWAGVTMWAGLTPTYSQGVGGDTTVLRAGLANADNYTSLAPLVINNGDVLLNPATGAGTQQFLLTQISINETCLNGVKAVRQTYYRYLET